MSIKFETSENTDNYLYFRDVEEDQFFIDDVGNLCQKSSRDSYQTIADELGTPFCHVYYATGDDVILKILDRVEKITWK